MKQQLKAGLISGSALGVLIGLLAASPVMAAPEDPNVPEKTADAGQSDETSVEEVVIVGSHIRRDTYNSPSPVQVITRDETTMAGYSSTTAALQGTAVTGGSAQINNAFGGFVTNGGPGANTISLRGLGAGRTLVLINGRRVSPAGTRGAIGSADLNVLPNAIIDHVEVLRDGASSIYGSDAVAGVVNVITRPKNDGVTLEAQGNMPTNGGGEEYRFSAVGGLTGERWNFSGSAEYYERKDLTLADRDWTKCNEDYWFDRTTGARLDFIDPATGKPKCYPITGTGSNGVTINTIGTQTLAGVGAPGSVGTTFNRWRPNASVVTGLIGYEGVGGGANNLNVRDTFDPRTLNRSLISPVKIKTVYGQGSYDLQAFGDAEIYFEVLGNERESTQVGYRQLSLDYIKGSPLIPSNLAGSTFQTAPTAITSGQAVGVRAFIGFGNDHSEQDVKFYKGTVGMRGKLSFGDWRYDLTFSYAKSDATYGQQSWLTDRLAETLNVVAAPVGFNAAYVRTAANGVGVTCAVNISDPTRGCIPAPNLTPAVVGGTLPQDWKDYTFRHVQGHTVYDESVLTLAADGTLGSLPAGDVKGAFGVEFRRAVIDDTPDPNSVSGNLYNLTSSTPTRGSDQVIELYGEIEAPILRDVRFAKELTFNGSYRVTDYRSYGVGKTYKLGGLWTPFDWVSLRATYGTSYRAPALFEQFQGATSGFQAASTDPCNNYGAANVNVVRKANCAAELPGQPNFSATSSVAVITAGGAAQGLSAETSKNFTAGVILQPPVPEGFGKLAIAVDYYHIEISNGVDRVGASNILAQCYDDPGFRTGGQGFCRYVDPRVAGSNQLIVHDSYTNIATQVVAGWDYNLRWTGEVGPGSLRLNLEITQYLSQASKRFKDQPLTEFNGTLNTPEYTGTFDATYSWNGFKFRYGAEWIAGTDSYALRGYNPATTKYVVDVPDYWLHNISVQYSAKDWSATVGVRNLADKTPPSISADAGYNKVGNAPLYSGYDYVGRTVFVNLSKHF